MELKNAPLDLMLFNLDLTYFDTAFYVINNLNPGGPINLKSSMKLIDENGDGYVWYTPLSGWNTYQGYPVKGIKKAADYAHKIKVFHEEPFIINIENE